MGAPGTLLGRGLQVDDLFGCLGIAAMDGLHQGAVLGHGLTQPVFGQRHQVAHHLEEVTEVGERAGEPGVVGHGLQPAVEGVDRAVVVEFAYVGDCLLDAGQLFIQRHDVLGDLVADGLAGTTALQQAQHGEEALDFGGRQLDDEGAPARHQPYQTFMGQHLQGLAQWGARGTEAGRQGQFVDAFAGLQAAFVDHLAQAVGDFDVQGRAGDLVIGVHGPDGGRDG